MNHPTDSSIGLVGPAGRAEKEDYAGQTILGITHWQDGRGAAEATAWSDGPGFRAAIPGMMSGRSPTLKGGPYGRLPVQNVITLTA